MKHSWHAYTDKAEEYFNKIQWVDADFDDTDSLQRALEGVTEVYHCAARVSFNPKFRRELYHTNIDGTKNLLYACEGSSVNKFCFISSIAVLDGFNENGELDEDSDFKHALEHSAYAKSKHFFGNGSLARLCRRIEYCNCTSGDYSGNRKLGGK